MKARALRQLSIFSDLRPDEIDHFAATLKEREFLPGTMIISEGEAADCLYVVVEGEVEIIMALGTLNERLVGVSAAGSFLGEMGLMNPGSRRTASVRARTPTRMLEMTRADFDGLLNRHPKLAYEIVRILSMRLDQAQNRTIRDLEAKNKQLSDAYVQLRVAQRQLVEKEKMEREMEVAREIQLSMVPLQRPNIEGFEFGARMVSARAVGGDFFDFIQLSPTTIGIAIGDVSDKGVPAALFMALTSNLLRAEARRTPDPVIAVRNVHRQLMEVNSSGMFVTLLYGLLDTRSRLFNYARAGHELPVLIDPSGTLTNLPYGQSLPVGADNDITIDQQTLQLEPGCSLLLYTDGLTDVVDSDQKQFGIERAQASFIAAREMPAQQICDALLNETIAYRGEASQYDDITMLVIHSR